MFKDAAERESRQSLCLSIKALIVKRFRIYSRDRCGLICEIIIPIILVIAGLLFLQVGWTTNSPSFALDVDAYPSPQTMMFNKDNVLQSTEEFTPE